MQRQQMQGTAVTHLRKFLYLKYFVYCMPMFAGNFFSFYRTPPLVPVLFVVHGLGLEGEVLLNNTVSYLPRYYVISDRRT